MCGTVDTSDEESTVSNSVPDVPTPHNNMISKRTENIVDAVQNNSNVIENDVCSEDVLNVPSINDIFFTDLRRNGEIDLSYPVQNVHGESKESENMTFIYSASDKDSDDIEDINSLMYMAKEVQNVDLLNFDDSDVSIGEEEEDLFMYI